MPESRTERMAREINERIASLTRGDIWFWGESTGKPGDGNFTFAIARANGEELQINEIAYDTEWREENGRKIGRMVNPHEAIGIRLRNPENLQIGANYLSIECASQMARGSNQSSFNGSVVSTREGFFTPTGPALKFVF